MENHTSDYRVEKDSIGTKDVPANVYYGVQSKTSPSRGCG